MKYRNKDVHDEIMMVMNKDVNAKVMMVMLIVR